MARPSKKSIDRLRTVIGVLRTRNYPKGMIGFNMSVFRNVFSAGDNLKGHFLNGKKIKKKKKVKECGTAACLGGLAHILSGSKNDDIESSAREWLALPKRKARELFYPRVEIKYHKISPEHAADVLEHLIETGIVDWTATKEKVKYE